MNKKQTILTISLVGIAIIGVTAWMYLNKDTDSTPVAINSQTEQATPKSENTVKADPTVVLSGEFKDADDIHTGSGTVEVIKSSTESVLSFKPNFTVSDGPDLFVYLSANTPDQELGEHISLGRLKSITGQQTYELPKNYTDYKTVVIWCEEFSVKFASAELK